MTELVGLAVAVRGDHVSVGFGARRRAVGLLPEIELGAVDRLDLGLASDEPEEDVVEAKVLSVLRSVVEVQQGGSRQDVGAGRDVRRPQMERIFRQGHEPLGRSVPQRRRVEHVT